MSIPINSYNNSLIQIIRHLVEFCIVNINTNIPEQVVQKFSLLTGILSAFSVIYSFFFLLGDRLVVSILWSAINLQQV